MMHNTRFPFSASTCSFGCPSVKEKIKVGAPAIDLGGTLLLPPLHLNDVTQRLPLFLRSPLSFIYTSFVKEMDDCVHLECIFLPFSKLCEWPLIERPSSLHACQSLAAAITEFWIRRNEKRIITLFQQWAFCCGPTIRIELHLKDDRF
jgi:hypothetical protein